jgi:hypothetical protein
MKTVKKKVAKKVSTPKGAAKKPSSLRVNAGGNTELFTYLENVKQDFLRGYKYPTQLSMKEQIVQGGKEFNKADFSKVPSLTIKEIEQLREEMEKELEEKPITYRHLTQKEWEQILKGYPKADPEFKPFADTEKNAQPFPKTDPVMNTYNPSPGLGLIMPSTGTSSIFPNGPMMGAYIRPEPPKEVTIKSLLGELADRIQNLNAEIYNHKDSIYPIIGDIPFADFEDIKQSPVPTITQLTQIISEVNAAKERLSQLTVAVQNTLG